MWFCARTSWSVSLLSIFLEMFSGSLAGLNSYPAWSPMQSLNLWMFLNVTQLYLITVFSYNYMTYKKTLNFLYSILTSQLHELISFSSPHHTDFLCGRFIILDIRRRTLPAQGGGDGLNAPPFLHTPTIHNISMALRRAFGFIRA